MKHIPNTITIVRIFFAPVFVWMLLVAGPQSTSALRWWAAGLFIVGMATDGLDGYLARKYNVVSDLGKLLDPIADKVLTGAALVTLSILGELPWWVTMVILAREISVTVYRLIVLSDHVVPASWGGKVKTVSQFVAISFALMPLQLFWGQGADVLNVILMTIATVVTVWTGLEYFYLAFKHRTSRSSP